MPVIVTPVTNWYCSHLSMSPTCHCQKPRVTATARDQSWKAWPSSSHGYYFTEEKEPSKSDGQPNWCRGKTRPHWRKHEAAAWGIFSLKRTSPFQHKLSTAIATCHLNEVSSVTWTYKDYKAKKLLKPSKIPFNINPKAKTSATKRKKKS